MSGIILSSDLFEMPAESLVSVLAAESVSAGYIPSVVMCMTCGIEHAQSRDESMFALCPDCAESLRRAYVSELGGIAPAWTKMRELYGYDMIDAELSKMFG